MVLICLYVGFWIVAAVAVFLAWVLFACGNATGSIIKKIRAVHIKRKLSKPISYEYACSLAIKLREYKLKTLFKFNESSTVFLDPWFKSNMNAEGEFYSCDIAVKDFPNFAAALLKSKKHEWSVMAVADDDTVMGFYVNKGDKESVWVPSLDFIIVKCQENGCHTILDFHNHPNGCPHASKADYSVGDQIFNEVQDYGINFIAFICHSGNYTMYAKDISGYFYSANSLVPKILNINENPEYKREIFSILGITKF